MDNIRIPKPCHQNWEKMAPEETGRHCSVCEKTVIDFTQKSILEVKSILYKNQNQKLCGRFNANMIGSNPNWLQRKIMTFYFRTKLRPSNHFVASFAMLLLFLMGCKKEVVNKNTSKKLIDTLQIEQNDCKKIEMGEPMLSSSDTIPFKKSE